MPIEIKELVIRTQVGLQDGSAPSSSPAEQAQHPGADGPPFDTQALVQECVRQVLQILARQRER